MGFKVLQTDEIQQCRDFRPKCVDCILVLWHQLTKWSGAHFTLVFQLQSASNVPPVHPVPLPHWLHTIQQVVVMEKKLCWQMTANEGRGIKDVAGAADAADGDAVMYVCEGVSVLTPFLWFYTTIYPGIRVTYKMRNLTNFYRGFFDKIFVVSRWFNCIICKKIRKS